MRYHCFKITAIIVLLSVFSIGAVAGEHEAGHGTEVEHGKHALGVFVGVTLEHDESLGTLGFEYSYRLSENWSVGGVIERADREKDSTLAIVFAHWFPYKGLFLGAGIGRKDPGEERENTFRATLGYDIELGRGWEIAPQVNLDVIEGHENEEVYGVAIAKRF
jgi:hypothetical protein